MSAYATYQRIYELEAQVKELEEKLRNNGPSNDVEGDNFLLFLVAILVLMNVEISDVNEIISNSNFLSDGMELLDILNNLKM
ncbi:hypothetical protein [Halobacillus sp. B23F22_1]|uniref:hypothetical protein n=1 Tax=Halobacillus sp. B23F22_1 TaxID=3459514 RepID=UPI00373F8704